MTNKNRHSTPYIPCKLPVSNVDWINLMPLIGRANRTIAKFDGQLQAVPNPEVLLAPLRTKEAVLSSKIEGTQATLEEVLQFDGIQTGGEARRNDIDEIINYRKAMQVGMDSMKVKPLSLNVIRKIHKSVLQGVRGGKSDPGNFRRIQNFIGPPGSTIENARFIPPDVPNMHSALNEWEKYLHIDDVDPLVQLAIVHAQFEIIHPFLDGNGRIGRILIPLFLFHKNIIEQPVFYMSDYLEDHRREYYDALLEITSNNGWTNWVRFFLEGVIFQAEKGAIQTKEITDLYEKTKHDVISATHSQYAIHCVDFIFSGPYFYSTTFHKYAKIPARTAARLLKLMEENEIVQCAVKGSGRKPSVYVFRSLVEIAEK